MYNVIIFIQLIQLYAFYFRLKDNRELYSKLMIYLVQNGLPRKHAEGRIEICGEEPSPEGKYLTP